MQNSDIREELSKIKGTLIPLPNERIQYTYLNQAMHENNSKWQFESISCVNINLTTISYLECLIIKVALKCQGIPSLLKEPGLTGGVAP